MSKTTKTNGAEEFVLKIEKNVPIPQGRGRRRRYPFDEMEIGDSFVVADEGKLRSAASWHGARHNVKFTIRKVEGGYRCWRIA